MVAAAAAAAIAAAGAAPACAVSSSKAPLTAASRVATAVAKSRSPPPSVALELASPSLPRALPLQTPARSVREGSVECCGRGRNIVVKRRRTKRASFSRDSVKWCQSK